MKLIGTQGWAKLSAVGEDKITGAIIRDEGKEIVLGYEGKKTIKLKSNDGIHFEGEYGGHKRKVGDCDFTLYKNKEGYFLFGGYSSPEDDNGIWWIALSHPSSE